MRVLFSNQFFPLVATRQRYCSDHPAETGTLFFPDRIQTQLSQILLHNEDSLLFVKGMLMTSLVTADVSDDVAQELLFDAQTLEDVESFAVRSRHS